MSEAALLRPLVSAGHARPSRRWAGAFRPRFFGLLLLGLVWIVPAWIDSRFLIVMVVWDLALMAVWAWDFRRLPSPGRLAVRRVWTTPLALGTESTVQLELQNDGRVDVHVQVLDDVPSALRDEPPIVDLIAPAMASTNTSYIVRPRERGRLNLGMVHLRYHGPLGIAERWATTPLAQEALVYPNLEEARRFTIYLIRSRQIELEKRLTRRRGRGSEFDHLRDYRIGDEWRDVCWTAAARRGRLITKQYRVERSQTVWLILDTGRLLRARVGDLSKLDYSVNAALSLSQLAIASGDRIGMMAYGRRLQHQLPPDRGARHIRTLIDMLALVRGETAEANHALAADALLRVQRRRSLVVWITDLAETAATPDVIEYAAPVLSRHLVLFIAIGHDELRQVATRYPEDIPGMYQQVAAQEVQQRRDLLLRKLQEQGALAIDALPGQLSELVVNQYLDIKDRGLL